METPPTLHPANSNSPPVSPAPRSKGRNRPGANRRFCQSEFPPGKNRPNPLVITVWPGVNFAFLFRKSKGHQRVIARVGRSNHARSRASRPPCAATLQFTSPTSTTVERVSPTEDTRPTSPSMFSTGRLSAQAIAAAEVDLHRPPPIRRVAQHDSCRASASTAWTACQPTSLAEAGVFARGFLGLHVLQLQLLVFAAELSFCCNNSVRVVIASPALLAS